MQYPKKARAESSQRRWQVVVDLVDVFRESVDYSTNGRLIEKLHRRAENFFE